MKNKNEKKELTDGDKAMIAIGLFILLVIILVIIYHSGPKLPAEPVLMLAEVLPLLDA